MHIAIIGAGISGLLTALELVEQGCSVDIFEQQRAGQAASWAGGGILSPMYPWRYPDSVNRLAQYGKSMYQTWNDKISPVSGLDFEIHETGMLIFDEADFEVGLNYKAQYQDPMQHCDLLHHEQLKQINPRVSATFQQAIYFPYLANIRNPRLLKSIVTYLKQHPHVTFHEHTWVQAFDLSQNRVQALRTSKGERHVVDQAVIATGAWSKHWSEQLQCTIPVSPVQGQMLLFKTPADWLPTMCMNQVMYLIPRLDGHIVCGSSMADVGFDQRPSLQTQQHIYKASLDMVPELADFPIVKHWAGLRPSSPTGVPYIGLFPELNNLWGNFGHYRNGLCMGPASARLLRELILGQPLTVQATPYHLTRLNHFA